MNKLLLALLVCTSLGCPPPPPPSDGGPVTNPSSWTDTARVVIDTAAWLIPAAQVVTNAILPEPARTIVARSLEGIGQWVGRLDNAVDAYVEAGGDRCVAHAAAAGLRVALMEACRTLVDNGFALGRPIERLIDAVGTLIDNLVPACQDAGWASARREMDGEVLERVRAAEARGIVLRRDLDTIQAPAR